MTERIIYTEDEGSFLTVRAWNGVAIGTLYREIDGYWVWQPSDDRRGYIPQEMLAALAIKLQELNKDWDAEVNTTLEKLNDKG